MNVDLKQLVHNGFILFVSNIGNSLLTILGIVVLVLLVLYFPYVIPLLIYILVLMNQALMKNSFLKLKAKSLGISIEKLKKLEENNEDEEYISSIYNK